MAANIYGLQQSVTDTENALQSSPTAYDPSASPTSSDITEQRRLMSQQTALDTAEGKALKESWYGPQNANVPPPPTQPGFLERTLGALQAPTKALVGAVKYATGKAEPGQGFLETVGQNITSKGETFGGLLDSYGLPHAISMPLGLALDIGADPVNWMTGGADTLIGRTGIGALKGGMKGAALGAESRGLELASKVASFIPGLRNPGGEVGEKIIAAAKLMKGDPELISAARAAGSLGTDEEILSGLRAAAQAKTPELLSLGMKTKAAVSMMGDKAVALRQAFNKTVGYDVMEELNRVAEHGAWGFSPGQKAEEFITKVLPGGRGEALIKNLKFSSVGSDARIKAVEALKEQVLQPLGWGFKEGEGYVSSGKGAELAAQDLAKSSGVVRMTGAPEDVVNFQKRLELLQTTTPPPAEAMLGSSVEDLSRQFQDIPIKDRPVSVVFSKVAENGGNLLRGGAEKVPADDNELMQFFAKAGMEEEDLALAKAVIAQAKVARSGETGIAAYDNAIAGLKTKVTSMLGPKAAPVVDKAIKMMDVMTKIFTTSKTALNPGTYTANFISGHIMAAMEGIDILSPEYLGAQKVAWDLLRGIRPDPRVLSSLVQKLGGSLQDGPLAALLKNSLDIDFSAFSDGKLIGDVLNDAKTMGAKVTSEDILQTLRQTAAEMKQTEGEIRAAGIAKSEGEIAKAVIKEVRKKRFTAPTSAIERIGQGMKVDENGKIVGGFGGMLNEQDLPNSFFLSQVAQGNFAEFLNTLNKKSNEGSAAAKALYTTLTKPSTWYGNIDKAQKLGTFIHLVTNGLDEGGLKIANKMVGFGADGIAESKQINGATKYLLTPEAAISIANDAGTNYKAMPAFVQLMRSIPIIGSPFVAFPYAMTAKLGKTLAYNPAFFNKVAFAMQEVSGRPTPLEKQAIEGRPGQPGYYSFLQGPGYLRIPFFQDHPVYLNMTNWLPYYSLNALMPSERNYNDTWAGKVSDVIDHSPLFKGPAGQMLIDYVLLPHLLSEGETAQGYFGQQLYPQDATAGQKAGYAARSLAEAYVPGVAGFAGLATPFLPKAMQQTGFIQNVPSYRYRALAQATQGKSALGIPSKSASVGRGILSALGAPTTEVDLTNQFSSNQ